MKETTETFSKFRELQRSTGAIPNTCGGLHRVYLIYGENGQMLEIGYATDPKLAMMKAAERIASNTMNDALLEARGIVVESASIAHYPKHDDAPSPNDIDNEQQLDEHYHHAEVVLTIGADRTGAYIRSSIAGEHTLPSEAVEGLPMRNVEAMTSDHPLAQAGSIVETLAMAVDVARQLIERNGELPKPGDDLDD